MKKRHTTEDALEQGAIAYRMGMSLQHDPYKTTAPSYTKDGLRSSAWRRGLISAWEQDGRPEGRIENLTNDGAMDTMKKTEAGNQPQEDQLAPLYEFIVNLNERGSFSASVYDSNGKSVYELRGGDELGEEESSLVDDGFLRHMEDLDGLTEHLQSLSIIPAGSKILPESEFEAALDEYIEEQREANRRALHVVVEPAVSELDLDEEDQQAPGAYMVLIDDDVPEQDWADVALDVFHGSVAISNLDDFNIMVVDPTTQRELNQRDDYEAYSGKDKGEYDEKLNDDWRHYMPVTEETTPSPSM